MIVNTDAGEAEMKLKYYGIIARQGGKMEGRVRMKLLPLALNLPRCFMVDIPL